MMSLDSDFERAFAPTERFFRAVAGEENRFFLTGGTGFFGAWLIESFLWLRKKGVYNNSTLTILSRNPELFLAKWPDLSHRLTSVDFISGDIRDFQFPDQKHTHVIHAATSVGAHQYSSDQELLKVIDQGTERVLELAKKQGIRNFLFVSSGAVYGAQSKDIAHMSEQTLANSPPLSAYGEGKRLAEARCLKASREGFVDPVIARCYAFIGPYFAQGSQFAVSSFARDAVMKKSIQVTGNPDTRRSYLYGADLSAWLWNLLFRGKPARPYHVGSEKEYSLIDVAHEFARQAGTDVQSLSPAPSPGDRYIPSTHRAREELGLSENFDLALAVERTLKWSRENTDHV